MKSDAQLQQEILQELDWDPAVDATDVGVIVKDGVVTLAGHLGTFAEKYAAERAAQRVRGVRVVCVELEVRLADPFKREDSEIAATAQRSLDWNTLVPGNVHAMVEKGWVTLTGDVQWDYQRKAAERAVRYLRGVVGLSNLITVKGLTHLITVEPAVSSADVKKGIQEALERHAGREAQKLQVVVDGSRVTLRGAVDSWADVRAALGAAWSAPGVASVVNELTVTY